MLDTLRHIDYFNPMDIKKEKVHIIGVGAVGSHIAEMLVRLGFEKLHIWDFDKVESHNIPNQKFRNIDIGKTKTEALQNQLQDINKSIELVFHERYTNEELSGYVFVCVDQIEIRRNIYENNEYNVDVKAMFDTRIGLDTGQVFSADWTQEEHREHLLEQTQFTQEESDVPTATCGTKLTVLPTVIQVSNSAVTNFINFIKTKTLKTSIFFNSFNFKSNSK